MVSIVLLGNGNVAHHLFRVIEKVPDFNVIQVFGRNEKKLLDFKNKTAITTSPNEIENADLYLIAVSDTSIPEVSKFLKSKNGLICHTSGSVTINSLETKRKGVFYPLQTFNKDKPVEFQQIPICIEAENKTDYLLLEKLGNSLSKQVIRISSDQRQRLHLCAVLVNNFPNHLFQIASEICEENSIPNDLLFPLISETVDKIRFLNPAAAQTGPAKRNDVDTMQRHLELLEEPLYKKIYQLLSESIKATHEKKL